MQCARSRNADDLCKLNFMCFNECDNLRAIKCMQNKCTKIACRYVADIMTFSMGFFWVLFSESSFDVLQFSWLLTMRIGRGGPSYYQWWIVCSDIEYRLPPMLNNPLVLLPPPPPPFFLLLLFQPKQPIGVDTTHIPDVADGSMGAEGW